MWKWVSILLLIFLNGCLKPVRELYPENEELRPVPIYVIDDGWHVGLALEYSRIKQKLPEHKQMPEANFLMFGWGDNRYYPNPDPGFWLLLRAAFVPTQSVVHVVGIDMPVDEYFPTRQIVKIYTSEAGADELTDFISAQFSHEDDSVEFVTDGLYQNSAFFKSRGLYFIPKTSNKWTARALRETGYPITPFWAITSNNVMKQALRDGDLIKKNKK